MQDTQAFAPFYQVSQPGQTGKLLPSVTIAATSAAAETSAFPGAAPNGANQLQIANTATTAFAYVNLGIAGAVTTASVASGYPIPPLAARVITVNPEVTAASVVMSAGSGNVIFTRGSGV